MLSVWLGNKESQHPVIEMQKAVSDGKLIDLMASSEQAMKLSAMQSEEDFRIGESLLQVNAGVAVISVKGSLVPDYNWYNSLFGVVSYEEIRDAVHMAASDSEVKNIVLCVESNGGAVTYLDATSDFIRQVDKNIKPVYGYTVSSSHSAGYWLISSTRSIAAAKMASIGSIGVIMTLVNYHKMHQEAGIEVTYLRSGEFKALGQSGEELSDKAKKEFQNVVMQLYGFFEDHVIATRGAAARQNKDVWGSGKTFFAKEALSLGLIDEINTFDDYISKMYDTSYIRFNAADTDAQLKTFGDTAMNLKLLSPEQAAKFASGVPIEDLGLSSEELEKVKAQTTSAGEEHETAYDEAGSASNEEQQTDDENVAESSAENSADLDKLIELSTKLAKTEVKLEEADAKLVVLEEEKTNLLNMQETLVTIAAEATNRFQVALGKSSSDFEGVSAESIVKQYEKEKTALFGEMPSGRTSSQVVSDREEAKSSLQHENTIIKKTGDK